MFGLASQNNPPQLLDFLENHLQNVSMLANMIFITSTNNKFSSKELIMSFFYINNHDIAIKNSFLCAHTDTCLPQSLYFKPKTDYFYYETNCININTQITYFNPPIIIDHFPHDTVYTGGNNLVSSHKDTVPSNLYNIHAENAIIINRHSNKKGLLNWIKNIFSLICKFN